MPAQSTLSSFDHFYAGIDFQTPPHNDERRSLNSKEADLLDQFNFIVHSMLAPSALQANLPTATELCALEKKRRQVKQACGKFFLAESN